MLTQSFGPISDQEELDALGALLINCFRFDDWATYAGRIGQDNFLRVRRADRLVAGLGIYRVGQWFGGNRLPMAAIAAVGVAPEFRGQGVAAYLLTETLQYLHREGVPIAALYASTQRLYRKVGFEPAGNLYQYSLDVTSISPLDRALPMRQIDPDQHVSLHDVYTRWATQQNGWVDRTRAMWERRLGSDSGSAELYQVGSPDDLQGYLLYTRPDVRTLAIRDLIALTPAAARRIWSFIADHRSLVKEVSWYGPAVDPHLSLLPEQTYRINWLERWLLRVVDVPGALQLRGYPPDLEAELHLQVQDDLIPTNAEPLILSLAHGAAEVKRGGKADLRLSIRGLAPLFTGLLSPTHLQLLGYLEGSPHSLDLATRIFAGPEPWILDQY